MQFLLLNTQHHVLYSFTKPTYAPPQLYLCHGACTCRRETEIARCRYVQLGVALGRIRKYEWCEQQANKKQVTAWTRETRVDQNFPFNRRLSIVFTSKLFCNLPMDVNYVIPHTFLD